MPSESRLKHLTCFFSVSWEMTTIGRHPKMDGSFPSDLFIFRIGRERYKAIKHCSNFMFFLRCFRIQLSHKNENSKEISNVFHFDLPEFKDIYIYILYILQKFLETLTFHIFIFVYILLEEWKLWICSGWICWCPYMFFWYLSNIWKTPKMRNNYYEDILRF